MVQDTYQVRTFAVCKYTMFFFFKIQCTLRHVHRVETRVFVSRHVYQLRDTCNIFETRILASRHVYCCETRLSVLLVKRTQYFLKISSEFSLINSLNIGTFLCLTTSPLYLVFCYPSHSILSAEQCQQYVIPVALSNVARFQQISDGKYQPKTLLVINVYLWPFILKAVSQ